MYEEKIPALIKMEEGEEAEEKEPIGFRRYSSQGAKVENLISGEINR